MLNTFAKSDLITLKNEKAVPKARGIGATVLPGMRSMMTKKHIKNKNG